MSHYTVGYIHLLIYLFQFAFPVKTGSELKEGATVSMNCQDVESNCKTRTEKLCAVFWIASLDEPHNICSRQIAVDSSDDSCFISLPSKYKDRTTYQSGGVVNIKNVRRNESGTYRCECKCIGDIVESKSYYGVIIVRK